MREYTHTDVDGRCWKTYEHPKLTSSFVRALDRRDLLASAKYHRSTQKDKGPAGAPPCLSPHSRKAAAARADAMHGQQPAGYHKRD